VALQRLILAKLAGDAAGAAGAMFERWRSARRTDDPCATSADDWPRRHRSEMDRFVAGLRDNAALPPVVFFEEYVDAWSSFGTFELWLTPDAGALPERFISDQFVLYHYRLPDGGALEARLRRGLRLKRLRQRRPQEDAWFVSRLLDAVLAWDGVVGASCLVMVREPLEGSPSDEEVKRSEQGVPQWLRPAKRRKR
jgi:hypothetical protein